MEKRAAQKESTKAKAPLMLQVAVIGGGFSGLAAAYAIREAGHNVHVYEERPGLEKKRLSSAYVPYNLVTGLKEWGVADRALELSAKLCAANWKTAAGELISSQRWPESIPPTYRMFCSDLQAIAYDLAVSSGVQVSFSSKVVGVDLDSPSIVLENGDIVDVDLIVGADGSKGHARNIVLSHDVKRGAAAAHDTRYVHGKIASETLFADPRFAGFGADEVISWMLPEGYVTLIPSGPRNGYYTLTYIFKNAISGGGSLHDFLRQAFKGFDPMLLHVVDIVYDLEEHWDYTQKPLPYWYHETGHLVLVGSACHPIKFPAVQDCALSLEDVQVLGTFLSRVSSPEQLASLLDGYQEVRQLRCEEVIASEDQLRRLTESGPAQAALAAVQSGEQQDAAGISQMQARLMDEGIHILDGVPIVEHDARGEAEHWWKHWGDGEEDKAPGRDFDSDEDSESDPPSSDEDF